MGNEPEVGQYRDIRGIRTNIHDVGRAGGEPVLLLHGSGPGVTAFANWRLAIPHFARGRRVIAPDLLGFGYTDHRHGADYRIEHWIDHLVGLLDELEIERAAVVGNSFGGALALHLALRHPERVSRVALMGSVGTRFELTPGLDAVWGYTPSVDNMRQLIDIFSYDASRFPADLAELRYRASIRPGAPEAFGEIFPAPRQRWIDALALSDEELRSLKQELLIIHGREDRVIPVASSIALSGLIENAQLHVFSHCGHWVQLEQHERFHRLVEEFLEEQDRLSS